MNPDKTDLVKYSADTLGKEMAKQYDEPVKNFLGKPVQYPMGATTASNVSSSDTVTLEDLQRALDMLEKNKYPLWDKMEMCIKHWRKLEKEIGYEGAVENTRIPVMFFGVNIFIKPYLKKVWVYKGGKRESVKYN